MSLLIKNLSAQIISENTEVIKNVTLSINPGEVHVLMGPNGSGKSSLSKILLTHPDYEIASGEVWLNDRRIDGEPTTEIAKKGLFLASQYPVEVPGVNLANFLRLAYNSVHADAPLSIYKFRQVLKAKLKEVGLSEVFMERNLNEGFSGGEKKKCEILQMLLLEPKYAILDETDSGLDIDAVKTVFTNLATAIKANKKIGYLIITHYHKVFDYIKPNFVHVFKDGTIVKSGGMEIAQQIEQSGYEGIS